MKKDWIVRDLLNTSYNYLKDKKIESPRLCAELLLCHALKMDRLRLYMDMEKPLTQKEISLYRKLVRRRIKGEPLYYIIGKREFWSLKFKVTPDVMIPRVETEHLVECAIEKYRKSKWKDQEIVSFMDIGVGCGNISISLLTELPNCHFYCTDISLNALKIARQNAKAHNVYERMNLILGDLFPSIRSTQNLFHIIVSNPPYIPTDHIPKLSREIREWEPRIALDGGKDGLRFIYRIISQAHHYLNPQGWLIMEIGYDQSKKVYDIAVRSAKYSKIEISKDLSGIARVVMLQKMGLKT